MSLPGKQSGQAPPTWLWVTALLAISAFAGLVMYLDYHQKRDRGQSTKADQQSSKSPSSPTLNSAKGKNLPPDGNKFDFYQLLPDLESIVSDKDVAKDKPASPAKNLPDDKKSSPVKSNITKPTFAGEEFYLQVGAYKEYQAADRMKANLALIGLKAAIQRVDIGTVGRVHRVRLGPYAQVGDMRHDQQKLSGANIPSIMVRSKVTSQHE